MARLVLTAMTVGGLLNGMSLRAATFGDDVEFLKKHVEVLVLADKAGDAKVALVPAYQGRRMTSTMQGAHGFAVVHTQSPDFSS